MVTYDVSRTKRAVQFLVDALFGKHHMKKVRTYAKRPRAMPFKGDAEILNELLIVGRQDPASLENLLAVVDSKRDDRGDYQREYMAQRRARERKVIKLEELMADRSLTLTERRQVLLRQSDVWTCERTKYLTSTARGHQRATGCDPTWLERTGFIKTFWAIKDQELDALLYQARTEQAYVARRRIIKEITDAAPVETLTW